LADVSELSKLGSIPIPGDSPTGIDAKYDEDYEKLKEEVSKLDTSPQDVKWREVVELGTTVLTNKSKDLQIGSYFAAALWNQKGYTGLCDGITILKDMIDTYWEDLFPSKKRMRGRVGALDWLAERVEKMMPGKPPPTEQDREGLTAAHAAAEALDKTSSARLDGTQTNLPILTRTLMDQLNRVPKPKPTVEAQPAKYIPTARTDQPVQTQQQAAPVQKAIDSPAAAKEALKDLNKTALKIATQLRKGEPTSPVSYRLLRTTLWSQIDKLPDVVKGGRQDSLDNLEKKLAAKEYPTCLETAETQLAEFPLWLDINLYAWRAMEGMGYTYDNARETLGQEVASLVLRFPALIEKTPEGEPSVCSDTTRLWISNELSGASDGEKTENGMAATVSKAKKLVTRKKLADAIAILDHEAKSAGDRREKFLWKLHLAQLCVQGGKPNLAMSLLSSLDSESTKFCLEEWEPELASEVLKLSVQCAKTGKDEASKEKVEKLYARLSSLDLSAALALDGKK
jgi:type VI secretion system protein VasJ